MWSFSGEISDFYLWKRPLGLDEQVAITSCARGVPGDDDGLLVDWATQKWNHSKVSVKELEGERCRRAHSLVMFPEKRNFDAASLLCKVLNGTMAVPEDEEANDMLHSASISNFSVTFPLLPSLYTRFHTCTYLFFKICHRRYLEYVWVGARDVAEEGVWRSEAGDRRSLVAPSAHWRIPWEKRPQEPNGGVKENCIAMKKG